MKNTKIKKLKSFDKWMRKIKNIHYGDNKNMDKAYDRVLSKNVAVLCFMISSICFSQVHMNAGITNISNRINSGSMTFSIGYNEMVLNKTGLKGSFRSSSVYGLNYKSVDLQSVYRLLDETVRLDLSGGASWNDVNRQINPIIGFKNYVEIDPSLFLTLEIESIFSERQLTHISFGIAFDATWIHKGFKPRFF